MAAPEPFDKSTPTCLPGSAARISKLMETVCPMLKAPPAKVVEATTLPAFPVPVPKGELQICHPERVSPENEVPKYWPEPPPVLLGVSTTDQTLTGLLLWSTPSGVLPGVAVAV